MSHDIRIDEGDRQAMILALARLSLERPGWAVYLSEIAAKLGGREMYDSFRGLTEDVPSGPPASKP